MRFFFTTLFLTALLFNSSVAASETRPGSYIQAFYGAPDFSVDMPPGARINFYPVSGGKLDTSLLTLAAGFEREHDFGFEIRLGFGLNEDRDSTDHRYKVTRYFSFLARKSFNLTDSFRLYGMIGMGQLQMDIADTGLRDTDFTYGFGTDYHFSDTIAGVLEYHNTYSDEIERGVDVKLEGIQLGLRYNF